MLILKRAAPALTLAAAGVLGGCVDMGTVEAMRSEAASARDALAAEVRSLEHLRESFPDDSPVALRADESLASARAKIETLESAVERIDLVLEEARNPTDALTIAAEGVSPLLPEPVRLPAILTAALAATLLRAAQLKRGAASMARSVHKALDADSDLRHALAKHADTMRTIQTGAAKRIVDQVTGKTRPPLLPI